MYTRVKWEYRCRKVLTLKIGIGSIWYGVLYLTPFEYLICNGRLFSTRFIDISRNAVFSRSDAKMKLRMIFKSAKVICYSCCIKNSPNCWWPICIWWRPKFLLKGKLCFHVSMKCSNRMEIDSAFKKICTSHCDKNSVVMAVDMLCLLLACDALEMSTYT